MTIKILPKDVAIKIAAGEVVERPLSVIKELIENSIDAKATEIIIQVEQAGKRLMEVTDNGLGISNDELTIAVERHATSKIQKAEDLVHISSLGFRGEALASIAAVSHFSIQSLTVEEKTGSVISIEGGIKVGKKMIGSPLGTTVRVEDLFFNTPARLKFLKQDLTEKRAIIGLIQKYAFAYSNIHFQLMIDRKVVVQTSGNGNRRQVLSSMFNLEEVKQLIEVDFKDGDFQIQGFTSPIGLTRSNRREINFFVNGRWISDSSLATALIQAYHTYLMVGRYPFAILELGIPLEEVDVNVHPAKAEIRFKNPGFIFSLVQRAIRHSLLISTPPLLNLSIPLSNPNAGNTMDYAWTVAKETYQNKIDIPRSVDPVEENDPLRPADKLSHIPLLRLIGQIGAAYLVAEGPDGLYLIDQHAAHERILFEKFNKLPVTERPKQQLLDPVTILMNSSDFILILPQIDILNRLGFDVDEFGENTIRVEAIPSLFSQSDPVSLIKSCIEDFEDNEIPLSADHEQKIIARICKRSAVKSGQILSQMEQLQLVLDLEQCHSPRTCPHGRPTMIHLSVDLLERQFGRKGSR